MLNVQIYIGKNRKWDNRKQSKTSFDTTVIWRTFFRKNFENNLSRNKKNMQDNALQKICKMTA